MADKGTESSRTGRTAAVGWADRLLYPFAVGVAALVVGTLILTQLTGQQGSISGPSSAPPSQGRGSAGSSTASPTAESSEIDSGAPPAPSPRPPDPPLATPVGAYTADWSAGLAGWSGSASWTVVDGELYNDGSEYDYSNEPTILSPFVPPTSDYSVEAQIQRVRWTDEGAFSAAPAYGISARIAETGSYQAGICASSGIYGCPGPNATEVFITASGANVALAEAPYAPDKAWHTLRLDVRGNELTLLLDGYVILTATDNRFLAPGRIGLWSNRAQIVVRSFEINGL